MSGGSRRKKQPYHRDRLDEDMIIHAALAYAKAYQLKHGRWKLPHQNSGRVKGHGAQTWSAWHGALSHEFRGLVTGRKGLGALYQRYGLKVGYKENEVVIAGAWRCWRRRGYHGLTAAPINYLRRL